MGCSLIDPIVLSAYTDPQCASHDHPDYGCVGQCVSENSCPGGKSVAGLCPSQRKDIKCCFTGKQDKVWIAGVFFFFGGGGRGNTDNILGSIPLGRKIAHVGPDFFIAHYRRNQL